MLRASRGGEPGLRCERIGAEAVPVPSILALEKDLLPSARKLMAALMETPVAVELICDFARSVAVGNHGNSRPTMDRSNRDRPAKGGARTRSYFR